MNRSRHIYSGSRTWKDWAPVVESIFALPPNSVVIEGGAKGLDHIAARIVNALIAFDEPLLHECFPAYWELQGNRAGPVRNRQMLNAGADKVHAYHPFLPKSKGTRNMVTLALLYRVPVELNNEPYMPVGEEESPYLSSG